MKQKKLATIALAAALAIGTFGISVPAKAAENSTDYTITIPATLSVANAGWNATDGITAQVKSGDTFDTSKKLTVTAESTNSWALKSGVNTIGYNLATATGTYSSTAEPASWEFSAADLNANGGKTNPMGIIVEDYSSKPAGTYQDTVTFTASVVNAATMLTEGTTAWTAGTYAVPAGGLTYDDDAITVSGDVTLTLTDDATLTLNKGISLAEGATLTIQGNGTMNVNGTNNSTASTVEGTGTLELTSGTLNAKGGDGGSVDPGKDENGGAGGNAINGNVTVSGGTLNATGGNGGSTGEASEGAGGAGGAAIGGDATISGGTWNSTNGENGGGQGGTGGKAVAGTVTNNLN